MKYLIISFASFFSGIGVPSGSDLGLFIFKAIAIAACFLVFEVLVNNEERV